MHLPADAAVGGGGVASALVRACPGVPTHAWPIPVLTGEFSIRFLALLTTILACLKQDCGSGGLKRLRLSPNRLGFWGSVRAVHTGCCKTMETKSVQKWPPAVRYDY